MIRLLRTPLQVLLLNVLTLALSGCGLVTVYEDGAMSERLRPVRNAAANAVLGEQLDEPVEPKLDRPEPGTPLKSPTASSDEALAQPRRDVGPLLRPLIDGQKLTLADVLESTRRQYPPLIIARLERQLADGRLLTAQGAFDLSVTAKGKLDGVGFYESAQGALGFEQPTPYWGSTLTGGYKIQGAGELPDYRDEDRTNRGGGWQYGLRVPLLRDGPIDARRVGLVQAEIDRALAEPVIARMRLDVVRAAARAYFAWVAAGRRLAVAEQLLELAQVRDTTFADMFRKGLVAEAVFLDNRRLVLTRQIGVVRAERSLQAAGLLLSLFLRDGSDRPVYVDRQLLPVGFPQPAAPNLNRTDADVKEALECRPELRRLRLQFERAELDRRLAENQLLPNLDVSVNSGFNIGDKPYKDKGEYELDAGVEFKLPVQRRSARGRLATAEATLERLIREQQFASDRIANEVRDALSELNTALEQIGRAREIVRLNELLERTEVEALRAGSSNLLLLNIREQNTADARVTEVDALAAYFAALADYRAALGLDGYEP